MLNKDAGMPIQAMPIGRGNATSPYTVLDTDSVIEFTTAGNVTCATETAGNTVTAVVAGSRYAIGSGVKTITFAGTFSVA